jgi:hypothetical protein
MALIYFGSQFAPLIIFFVMFLSIVKNNKLHHFVRFNCMQARRRRRCPRCAVLPRASFWRGLAALVPRKRRLVAPATQFARI